MAVQREVATRWQAVTGVPIAQGYGLTEASPIVTGNPLHLKEFTGSVGVPFPSTEVAIFDDGGKRARCRRGRRDLRAGSAGHGRLLEPARRNRAGHVRRRLAAHGRHRTRSTPPGIVFIEDRKKDVIVVSGFKVYPNEIEDVATRQPGVREAAAVGVPDAQSGEVVKLFVVRKTRTLTAADVLAHARRSLTGYKVPRHVEFLDELPKSNVGKVLRRALKERGAAQPNASPPR